MLPVSAQKTIRWQVIFLDCFASHKHSHMSRHQLGIGGSDTEARCHTHRQRKSAVVERALYLTLAPPSFAEGIEIKGCAP